MEIFKQFRNKGDGITTQQLGRYKSRVEQEVLALGEHIFGFVFVSCFSFQNNACVHVRMLDLLTSYISQDPIGRLLSIQLLDEEDYPLETDARAAYNEYVSNYSDFNVPTEGIDQDAKEKQFLKRYGVRETVEKGGNSILNG